jgi:hypothetical protein
MAAEILLAGIRATVRHWEWECEDEVLRQHLQMLVPEGGPGGEIANPDKWLAQLVCEKLGGELVWSDPTKSVPGAVH